MHDDLPSVVHVGPYVHNIKLVANLRNDKGEKCYGLADHSTHSILIDVETTEDRARVVLLHEILHMIWELTGLKEKDLTEEDVIVSISPMLALFMQDNTHAVEYIIGRRA